MSYLDVKAVVKSFCSDPGDVDHDLLVCSMSTPGVVSFYIHDVARFEVKICEFCSAVEACGFGDKANVEVSCSIFTEKSSAITPIKVVSDCYGTFRFVLEGIFVRYFTRNVLCAVKACTVY